MDNNQPWNNNTFTPQNTNNVNQPPIPSQPMSQPAQPMTSSQTPNNPILETPVLSPTHFDQINNRPNTQPAANVHDPAKTAKNLTIVSIILGIVAVIGVILGIFGLIDSMATHDDLVAAEAQLATNNAVISKIETQTNTKITSPDSVPDYAPITGYIYIPEWGIKIKIPDNLHQVSYIVDQKYRPQICFNGLESSVTNVFPAFADVDRNPGGMGCLTRVDINEGRSTSDGYSFGELVFTDNGYNYFYDDPDHLYSSDAAEQGLEQNAIQIIKNMLTQPQSVSSYR